MKSRRFVRIKAFFLAWYATVFVSICGFTPKAWSEGSPVSAGPTIGLIQYFGGNFGNTSLHDANLHDIALRAVKNGAKILLMPEGAIDGYGKIQNDTYIEVWCRSGVQTVKNAACRNVDLVAQSEASQVFVERWRQFAILHQIYVVFGIPERVGNVYYNSAFVLSPEGSTKTYQKNRLFWTDQGYAKAGTQGLILDLPFGRFGLMICADTHYAIELFNEYAKQQVDGIFAIGFGIYRPYFESNVSRFKIPAFYSDAWDSAYINAKGQSTRPALGEEINGYSLFSLQGKFIMSEEHSSSHRATDHSHRIYQVFE